MAELLSVPLKKSSDVDIVKPLKNLLQSTYNSGESHEDYSDVLNELSQLRTAAIWKVFEKSSLDVLYNYYDQLVSLESKVPPQEVQIPFKWKDAFDKGSIFGGRMSLTVSSLSYERLCVLFNIAALQSSSAAQQPLDTEDSLKLAAKLLQQAAGALAQVKGGVLAAVQQEPTPDLAPDTLDALAKLMLAQAQEVIVYKCIRDEMKDSMVAKVCGGAEELYTDALRAMQKDQVKHLWERDWISNVQAKQTAFRGLTQLYQSMECQARGAVGEQIARLQIAAECLRGATARLRAAAALGEQGARAARLLAAALRDNDFIYHERVPEPGALEAPPRAVVAKPAPPAPQARLGSGADLFARLVPLRVAGALAGAEARRAARVQAEVARLRDATQLLNSVLASLNLPAAVERPAPGQLPPSIRDKAAAVRAAGGAAALLRLMDDLPDLLRRNTDILDEVSAAPATDAGRGAHAARGGGGGRGAAAAVRGALDAHRLGAAHGRLPPQRGQVPPDHRQRRARGPHRARQVRPAQEVHRAAERVRGRGGGRRARGVRGRGGGRGGRGERAARHAAGGGAAEELAGRAGGRAEGRHAGAARAAAARRAARGGGAGRRRPARPPGAALRPRRPLAAAAGGAVRARAARGGGAGAGARRRGGAGRRAGGARRRARRLPGAHRQPHRGHQLLQRPHAAAARLPEQGVRLLLRSQDGEGGAAEGPDAGGGPLPRPAGPAGAGGGEEGGAGASPAPRRAPRGRLHLAAVPDAAAGHAAAVRRERGVPVLRGADADGVQPVRDAAVPAPRGAAAPAPALPAVPAPAPAHGQLPAGAPARVQPLPAAVTSPPAPHVTPYRIL